MRRAVTRDGDALLLLDGAVERSAAVEAWLGGLEGELGVAARRWFGVMQGCGDEVRVLMHDGGAVACVGDAPFGYVMVFRAHMNVGFFRGALLRDPAGLLEGTGKRMRHLKVRAGAAVNEEALRELIRAAYAEMKERVQE